MATTTVQQPREAGLVDERFDVMVDGKKVGELVRNKHRMWWGHFDTESGYTVAAHVWQLPEDGPRHYAPGTFAGASRRKTEVLAWVVGRRAWTPELG